MVGEGTLPLPSGGLVPTGLWDGPSKMWCINLAPCPAPSCPEDLPRACLTLMGSVAAELSPTPASLTDLTQNSYSFPVFSPGTVNLGEKCAVLRDGLQLADIPKLPRTTLWDEW